MHFKFLIFRNWKGSADSGENIWRSPYSRKLEGHQVWKDGHVGQPGNHKFFPYILYYYKVEGASMVIEFPVFNGKISFFYKFVSVYKQGVDFVAIHEI